MPITCVKGSRKRIRTGMCFTVHVESGPRLPGYVARDDAYLAEGGDWDCFVVYIFRPDAPAESLRLAHLLTPPLLVSRRAWTMGLFDLADPPRLRVLDVPDRHCFRSLTGWEIVADGAKVESECFDEYCTPCRRCEPCGVHAVTLLAGIEEEVCGALARLRE